MPATFDGRTFAKDLANALNTKSADGILHYYSENVEVRDPSMQQPQRGHAALRKQVEQWSAISEVKFEPKEVVTTERNAALLYEATGRHTGELDMGTGEKIPATNKPLKMEIAEFLTLDGNGKITKDNVVFDLASMMTQLGLLPSPQATGAPQEERGRAPTRPR